MFDQLRKADRKLTELLWLFQVSEKSPDPKKRGKSAHAQDLEKETSLSNGTSGGGWNRPRCGVPDFPVQRELHHRGRQRQRRYVLYGGRLEKTDLTYRYGSVAAVGHRV